MALSYRRRGKAGLWYARGTVRVGRETIPIAEFSTGTDRRADATTIGEAEAERTRRDHIDGPAGRARRLTIADCMEVYLDRPGGVRARDLAPIRDLNAAMGDRPVADAPAGWRAWVAAHGRHAPATLHRTRTILAAALRHGCAAHDAIAPALPAVKVPRSPSPPILPDALRARLLAAYNPHAACPVLLMAYQGMRTGETLRLDWRDCQPPGGAIWVRAEETKSGRGRAIPMHSRVALLLWGMWEAAGRPDAGPVFIGARGEPYSDQREAGGGSPLATAHATACRRVGLRGFRLHDWRHDYAGRMVRAGVDLRTLADLCGWSTLRMTERYVTPGAEHLREAVRRVE